MKMYYSKILIDEIFDLLEKYYIKNKGVSEVIRKFENVSLTSKSFLNQTPNVAPKEESLSLALKNISDEGLMSLKDSISNALPELKWNIDNGSFYEENLDVGSGYLNGNMNCELIGPKNGIFKSLDFRLGLFLLEPGIFYRDHNHEAPELYLNLSNKTKWRFGSGQWKKYEQGSVIYNKPWKVHSMKVYDLPFLSVWCWPYNSLGKCNLIPKKDWNKIEKEMEKFHI